MSEKDFVMAWMLTHRAAIPETMLTQLAITQLMVQAGQVYKLIEQEYGNEANCGTTD
jgi:hypothetical protein